MSVNLVNRKTNQKELSGEIKTPPVAKLRIGNIILVVWKNQFTKPNKEVITNLSFNLEKIYKDKNDKWNTTKSINVYDIPKVQRLLKELQDTFVFSIEKDINEKVEAEEE